MQRINHTISLLTAFLVLFLAGSAFFLSFEALRDLAIQIGVAPATAWLYPAIIDGAIVIFSLSVLRANLNGERTLYPWALVSVFTILSIVLNIIHAEKLLLAQFLAAIPPVALFLSFELLLAQLKSTATRMEALDSLAEIVRKTDEKETKLDSIVRNRTDRIAELEEEIEQLEKHQTAIVETIPVQSNGQHPGKTFDTGTIGRARRTRTKKKEEAVQHLLKIVESNPNASLSDIAVEIGRSKSTVGGYVSELVQGGRLQKGVNGWWVSKTSS